MPAARPNIETDLKELIYEWKGYSPRTDNEFQPVDNITEGENIALELPVGAFAKSRVYTRLGHTNRVNPASPYNGIAQGGFVWKKTSESFFRVTVVAGGCIWEAQFIGIPDISKPLPKAPLSFVKKTDVIFSQINNVEMVSFNDFLYIVDGANFLRKWDGTNYTDITIAPTADNCLPSIIILHANRLWVNNTRITSTTDPVTNVVTTVNYKNYLYASEFGDGDAWVADPSNGHDAVVQRFTAYPDEASPILALGVYTMGVTVHLSGRIFFFTTQGSPYNADGSVTWEPKELKIDRGSVNHRTLADLGEKQMYLTTRGVHELSGIQALQGLSVATYDTLNAVPVSYDVEPDLFSLNWDKACATFFKFYYILTLRNEVSGQNDTALVYDTRRKCWFPPWTNYGFNKFQVINVNGDELCFAFSSKDNGVYTLMDSTTDNGTSIKSSLATSCLDFRSDPTVSPEQAKTFRDCYMWLLTGNNGIYASYSIDYAPWQEIGHEFKSLGADARPLGQFILGSSRLGYGFMGEVIRKFSIGRRGRHCRIKIANYKKDGTGAKAPFGVTAMALRSYREDLDRRSDYA